jgi:hypothetical protein
MRHLASYSHPTFHPHRLKEQQEAFLLKTVIVINREDRKALLYCKYNEASGDEEH